MTLCNMIHTIGGLGPSKHVTLEEKVVLRLQANLPSTPNPITEANIDPQWNCFQVNILLLLPSGYGLYKWARILSTLPWLAIPFVCLKRRGNSK
ncbi:hypothetical protein ACSBR1_018469 [Camellia fascicularis]